MNSTLLETHKKKIIIAAFVFVFILLISLLLLNLKKTPQLLSQKNLPFPTSISQKGTGGPAGEIIGKLTPTPFKQSLEVFPPPAHVFETYENATNLPAIPQTVKQYTFKTNFTVEDVRLIASKLGLTESKTSGENYVIFYSPPNTQNLALLTFNLASGEYIFENYTVQSSTTNTPPIMVASNFLKSAGLIDNTVTCPITYQKLGVDNTTFVECHRDWNKAGLPILGFVGTLNVAENKPLTQLTVGLTDDSTPVDSSIINVSNGENGKARPNDFNTTTVAVSSQGQVIFIQSNIRQIVNSQIISHQNILTPQEALNQFIAQKTTLTISSPRGSGTVDLAKVYPQNKAQAKKATITDYLLTYLEKPPKTKQANLTPTYLIRGTAELESGYTVKFIEAVPALKTLPADVLGTSTSLTSVVAQPTYPAGKLNPLGEDRPSQSWRCLKSEPYEENVIKPGGKTDHRAKISGDGFPAGANVYLVSCLSEKPTSQCTTGHTTLDITLGLIRDPQHIFIVDGGNPFTLPAGQTTFEKIAYSYSGGSATHSFYGVVVLEPTTNQGKGDSLQYGSFLFKQDLSKCTAIRWTEPSPTPLPITSTPTQPPLPTPTPQECCIPSVSALNPIYETEGVKFGQYQRQHWYYIPPAGATENTIRADIEKIKQNFQSVTGQTTQFRQMDRILQEFTSSKLVGCPDCPTRTTGPSPSLFVYGQKESVLTIRPQMALTYADPSIFEAKMWSIVIKGDNLLQVNNLNRDYIYYEYLPVKFNRPKDGWILEKSNLEKFAAETASNLAFTKKERERLVFELKHAASEISGKTLFIGLIPQKEVEEKLPLTITPQPETVYRYHFYITSAYQNQKTNSPKLSPLERKEFMMVELGAMSE